jgi:CHAD domain-containing protein
MRIGFTRLAAAQKFFSTIVTDSEWSVIKSEIAWLNNILGKTRDNDVALVYTRDNKDNAFVGFDQQEIDRKVASSHTRVVRALASRRYRTLLGKLGIWIDHGPWTTAADSAKRNLRKAPLEQFASHRLKRWSHRLARYDGRPIERVPRHRVRIMAKRYRYMVEGLSELGVEISRTRLREADAARRLQRILGDLRDLSRIRRSTGAPRTRTFRRRQDKLLLQTRMAFEQFS